MGQSKGKGKGTKATKGKGKGKASKAHPSKGAGRHQDYQGQDFQGNRARRPKKKRPWKDLCANLILHECADEYDLGKSIR
jgi:hypothetical protein